MKIGTLLISVKRAT